LRGGEAAEAIQSDKELDFAFAAPLSAAELREGPARYPSFVRAGRSPPL